MLPNISSNDVRRRTLVRSAIGAALLVSAGACQVATASPPKANSAWVYDVLNRPGKERTFKPGLFAKDINDYNSLAKSDSKISSIYSYFGSMELYCPGQGTAYCPISKMILSEASGAGERKPGAPRSETLSRYHQDIDASEQHPTTVEAVIDGVVNAHYAGSLRGFNELSQSAAEAFADKITERVCSDPDIDGVQFDLEPFNVNKQNGQYFFYKRIANNFAAATDAGKDCANEDHPTGRYFSVFAAARHLQPGTPGAENLQDIMHTQGNAYMIAPLYDLAATPLGQQTGVANYRQQVQTQTAQLAQWANEAQVYYKFGVPAAASVHEFAGCNGKACRQVATESISQLDYLNAAIEAINNSGARGQLYYLGTAIWAWSQAIVHGGAQFSPASPPADVIHYLQQNL